jgi:Nucleotide-diphospho-sugar transferase
VHVCVCAHTYVCICGSSSLVCYDLLCVSSVRTTQNWLCSIQQHRISNLLLFAAGDVQFGEELYHRGYHVFAAADVLGERIASHDIDYGTVVYQELIFARTQLVDQLLRMDYNVMISDVDMVWLKVGAPERDVV